MGIEINYLLLSVYLKYIYKYFKNNKIFFNKNNFKIKNIYKLGINC